MRLLTAVVSVLLLTACGSGSPTDTKPVPVVLVPATVAVTAGAGQQAVPGANLTVKLVVTVKDGSGQPVPGISVGFAVDSGGGSLQSASATTASDGTASPGDWKMGPTEARNVLRVTVGALPPVRILALGAMVPVTIPDLTVGSGGGTITVAKPGAPIDGMKIVVPAGAFASGQTVGITYGSALGVTVPAGVTIISPLLTFRTSDGGIAASPMLITIPVVVPAETHPAILLRDAASGSQELLTTVAWSATSVTGMSGHLNGALLMRADGSFATRTVARRDAPAFRAAGGTGTAVVIALPNEMLALDHDTGFRPGVDSWEFRPIGTIVTRNLNPGIVATEAWYYIAKKASNGSLWKKYQEAAGIEESNRRGLRWTSVAQRTIGNQLVIGIDAFLNNIFGIPLDGGMPTRKTLTLASFNSVRGALTVAPGSPQMASLNPPEGADYDGEIVLVYRSTGQKLFAVDPSAPNQTIVIDFSSGTMAPVTLRVGGPPYTSLFAIGFDLLATTSVLQSQWSAVADGTIGNDLFAKYQTKVGWGTTAAETADLTDPVFVFGTADRVNIWADCVTCFGEPRPSTFAPGAPQVARFVGFQRAAGAGVWSTLGAGTRLGVGEANEFGLAILAKPVPDSAFEWADWKSFATRQLPATLAPANPTADANTDVNLTLTVTGAPANLEYVWDFTDGTAQAITSTPAVTHQWTSGGNYIVKVTARDKTTRQPVAKASTTATISGASYSAWSLSPSSPMPGGSVPPPDSTNNSLVRTLRAYNALAAYWSAPRVAPRLRTFWFVPATTRIDFNNTPAGLYLTDSLPGSGFGGGEPGFHVFAAPGPQVIVYDDPLLNWNWNVSGSPPANATISAQYETDFPFGDIPQPCLGQDQAPYWYQQVNFAQAGTTGSGTITYTFRDLEASCLRPRVVRTSWRLVVPFTAVRVR